MIFRHFPLITIENKDSVLPEWFVTYWNTLIEDMNTGLRSMSLTENFNTLRTTVSVTDTGDAVVFHNLKTIPSYHLVLNGIGGVVRGSTWNEKVVSFKLDSDLYTSKTKTVDLLIAR